MAKYTLLKQEGTARRGQFETVHGTVQTPAFMNVATSAAIKGGLSTDDLKNIMLPVLEIVPGYLSSNNYNIGKKSKRLSKKKRKN